MLLNLGEILYYELVTSIKMIKVLKMEFCYWKFNLVPMKLMWKRVMMITILACL